MRWCGCSDDHQGARTNPAMSAKWDTHIVAKRPKAHLAERHWRQRSRLLLPNRTRLNAVRAFCVKLDTLAVGSSWSPCNFVTYRYGKDKLENPLCSYLNSSIGILALLGNRTNRVPSYSRFSIDDQRKPAVPDFAVLGDAAVTELAAAYDAHSADILLPLPQMNADPVRRALDDAVESALGLDGETVAAVRRNLAMESSVTGRRYAGAWPAG